jgi:hypothetical protein
MASKTWTLINNKNSQSLDQLTVAGSDLGPATKQCHLDYQLLRGGQREGLHQLIIDNGALRVAILPERGMGLWRAWTDDVEIGWNSPVQGPVHPRWVPVCEPSGLGWLDGFDELLVRCGLHSNGAPEFDAQGRLLYPLHGRIANLPAHRLDVSLDESSGEIVARGIVEEIRFHFHKLRLVSTVRLRPGETLIEIQDEITNLSGNPGEMQLLYHINFGPPLHAPGGQLVLPVKQMAPRDEVAANDVDRWNCYGPPTAGVEEQVNFFELQSDPEGFTRALLENADGNQGVSVCYNVKQLPYFSQWKNTAPESDGYVTGLEPATNFPNPRSFESQQGRVPRLAPDETRRFDLQLVYHGDTESVQGAEQAVRSLAENAKPVFHHHPRADWTAGI